jgi:hypothetical protein
MSAATVALRTSPMQPTRGMSDAVTDPLLPSSAEPGSACRPCLMSAHLRCLMIDAATHDVAAFTGDAVRAAAAHGRGLLLLLAAAGEVLGGYAALPVPALRHGHAR